MRTSPPRSKFRERPDADPAVSRLARRISLLALGFAVVLVYGQTLRFSFHFDDRATILDNPAIRAAAGSGGALFRHWPTRFIPSLSFRLNLALGGARPAGFHLANLLIHLANTLLVFSLLLGPLRRQNLPPSPLPGAILGAAIFALHPVQTQAVIYISQRSALLAAFFYLAGAEVYFRGVRERRPPLVALAWLSGAAAMFCKEMAITFPLALILGEAIFLPREPGRGRRAAAFLLLLLVIPLTVGLHAGHAKYNDSGQISFWTGRPAANPPGETPALSRSAYAATQVRVLVTYLRLIVFPAGQNLDYDYPVFPSFFHPTVILSALLILSFLIFACFRGKEGKTGEEKAKVRFGVLFFFLALLPESSFIPIRDVIFEHRLYLPLAGIAFLCSGAEKSARRLSLLVPLLFGILAFGRARVWQSEISLWVDAAAKSPGKPRPFNNLGYLYNREGLHREAKEVLTRALKLNPSHPEAMVNLAIAEKSLGDLEGAGELCGKALELAPNYPEAHNTRGDVLRLLGRTGEAEKEYLRALDLDPGLSDARNNLANLYRETGRPLLAEKEYRSALAEGGETAEYLSNLGLHLLEKGDGDGAEDSFRMAIAVNPSLPQAHYNLGNAYARRGKIPEAIASYSRAIDLKPDYGRAYFNRGQLQAAREDWEGALADYLAAAGCEANAAAEARAGLILALVKNDPEQARPHLLRALEIDPRLPERKAVEKALGR